MTQEERKAKEQELYGLMEMDVMRDSEEVREVLGELLNEKLQESQLADGLEASKFAIDTVYPKIMTYQQLPDDLMEKLGINEEDMQRISVATELVQSYQRGEIDIEEAKKQLGYDTQDNEK